MTNARVDAAAIGIMPADRHVIDPYKRSKQTHRPDQPGGTVSGYCECETDDVSFAGSPVAIEDRCSPLPVDITRSSRRRAEFHNSLINGLMRAPAGTLGFLGKRLIMVMPFGTTTAAATQIRG